MLGKSYSTFMEAERRVLEDYSPVVKVLCPSMFVGKMIYHPFVTATEQRVIQTIVMWRIPLELRQAF